MEATQTQALKAIELAAAKANEIGVNANITVIDTAGHLKTFLRMDDAFLG